ncbi:hypothetical protein AAG570_005499, partial [Ranatra chinensis]
ADISPPAYIVKYNKFVDNILERINKILRKSYDPVNVRLQTVPANPPPQNGNKNKKKKKKNKNSRVNGTEGGEVTSSDNLMQVADSLLPAAQTRRPPVHSASEPRKRKPAKASNPTPNKNKAGNVVKAKSPVRARATLYGLSSIQRSGDVTVNVMSSHTTVKTKFLLGPLVLKVEKEFGRGAKKELRSATATTAEMGGKLNLRVLHGGAATLHSIRVFQPKQVRVETPDDNDRTREFVWRKSSHIAHMVSQKLMTAARSLLKPPPSPAPAA